ncbi:MAG: MATE family efflux transporter [Dehalococcoidales bacterium]|nr:MAG: MATE family efflux transporter [Dehalococcoidales bacterium]
MINTRQQMLASGSVGKVLWKLSYPAAIGAAVMALYNVVDTIFIGQIVGPLGIAGLTVVFPLQILGMGMGMMIGMGASSIISRALGADDPDKAERTLGNAVFYSVVIGLFIAVLGLSASTFWLRLAGASDAILPYAKPYFTIIMAGMVFRIGGMGLSNLIRSEGNARYAMLCMVVSFALNIVLDAVFVLWLNMGIQGAAIATVISEFLTIGLVIRYYLSGNSTLKIHTKNYIPDWKITREMMAIGFGAFVMTAGGSFVMMLMNNLLRSYGGDIAIASFGMIHRSMTFFFIPIMSVGQGLQPLLGFSYGAGRYDRALASIKLALIVSTCFAIVAFLIVFFFAEPLMHIFTQDAELISASASAAKILFLAAYLIGFQMVGQTVFQSLGKAVATFLVTTSRQIIFLLPLIFILSNIWGLNGIWYSFPISDGLSFLLVVGLLFFTIKDLKHGKIKTPQLGIPPKTEPSEALKAGGYIGGIKTQDPSDGEEY